MHAVSLGGLTVGLSILIVLGMRWWYREKRRWAALVPTLIAIAFGMLVILCAGGLLALLAGVALWGANGIGNLALIYGVGGSTPNVTSRAPSPLTPGGHAVVVLLLVVLACLWRFAGKVPNLKLGLGTLAGICLGLVGTIAGAAALPLANAVNLLGAPLTAMM